MTTIVFPNLYKKAIGFGITYGRGHLKIECFRSRIALQKRYITSKWSYTHRAGMTPFISAHVGNLIDIAEMEYGDTEAVVSNVQGIRKTYKEFAKEINELAAGFIGLNLNIGDRIGIWSPNCYEWLLTQIAAAKAGLILVPINPSFQVPEVDYCIKKVNLKAIVIYDQFKNQNYHQMLSKLMPEINHTKPETKICSEGYPYFESILSMSNEDLPGTFKLRAIMEGSRSNCDLHEKLQQIQNQITMESPLCILFTSGTTGKAKGAILSHFTVVNRFLTIRYKYDPPFGKVAHRVLTLSPLFHTLGCLEALQYFIDGYTIVLTGPTYDPAYILKTIQNEKCDSMTTTATMYFDLLNHPDSPKTDMSSMKKLRMGGSLCPPPLISRLQKEWNCSDVLTGYGSTETSGAVCRNEVLDTFEEKLYTSGKPVDFMEVKVVDENGNLLPRGKAGEICARGFKLMQGYWNDKEKTDEVLKPDGWYHTGDVGIMLENDCIQVIDRIRDMIIRGGENIYPKEIEDFLITHPKIREAYVIGVPDDRMGEEICVWIQCKINEKLTEDEIKEFCKGQLARFKVPRYIRFVNDFPKTVTGKIQKHKMREEEKQVGLRIN